MSSRITAIFSKTNRQHTLSRLFFLFSFFFCCCKCETRLCHASASYNEPTVSTQKDTCINMEHYLKDDDTTISEYCTRS